jgi:hypothetical protein
LVYSMQAVDFLVSISTKTLCLLEPISKNLVICQERIYSNI